MNLTKLFDMQRVLDERIEKEHPRAEGEDRGAKKILALQVELGELANEWRGFKFWSNDQESRRRVSSLLPNGYRNPLLEEYVDCLHFILSIGLEDKQFNGVYWVENTKEKSVLNQFSQLYKNISRFFPTPSGKIYLEPVLDYFLGLGEMLGFTWEQIEQAYISKNEVNHERQNAGY